jgi:probable metal-binding protein
MQEDAHEHEVLRTMIEADRPFTGDALRAAIAERFGEDARFHIYSSESMNAGEPIESLRTRSKLRVVEGGWSGDQGEICRDNG